MTVWTSAGNGVHVSCAALAGQPGSIRCEPCARTNEYPETPDCRQPRVPTKRVYPTLSQNRLDNISMNVRQPEMTPLVFIRQPRVIDAHAVQNRRV